MLTKAILTLVPHHRSSPQGTYGVARGWGMIWQDLGGESARLCHESVKRTVGWCVGS